MTKTTTYNKMSGILSVGLGLKCFYSLHLKSFTSLEINTTLLGKNKTKQQHCLYILPLFLISLNLQVDCAYTICIMYERNMTRDIVTRHRVINTTIAQFKLLLCIFQSQKFKRKNRLFLNDMNSKVLFLPICP